MSWSMGGNMSIKTTIAKYGLGKMIDQLYENPQKGMQTIMSWADKFSRGEFVQQREVFRKIFENEEDETDDVEVSFGDFFFVMDE